MVPGRTSFYWIINKGGHPWKTILHLPQPSLTVTVLRLVVQSHAVFLLLYYCVYCRCFSVVYTLISRMPFHSRLSSILILTCSWVHVHVRERERQRLKDWETERETVCVWYIHVCFLTSIQAFYVDYKYWENQSKFNHEEFHSAIHWKRETLMACHIWKIHSVTDGIIELNKAIWFVL